MTDLDFKGQPDQLLGNPCVHRPAIDCLFNSRIRFVSPSRTEPQLFKENPTFTGVILSEKGHDIFGLQGIISLTR